MVEIELSETEQVVYAAVAAVEQRVGAAPVDEIASEARLDLETTLKALSSLAQDDKDLVRELSGDDTDLGPRYRVKDTAG